MNWYMKCLQQYADFNGRARRREYWMFVLVNFLIACVISLLIWCVSWAAFISYIYSIALLVPSWAVSVRRMHDIGKSGWWVLVAFIPVIGWIWFILLMAKEGERGANQWGPDPKSC